MAAGRARGGAGPGDLDVRERRAAGRASSASVGGTSIYGPLAAPIVVLIWLYFLAIAVLIGAALNAAVDDLWPHPARVGARRSPSAHAGETALTPPRRVARTDE